MKVVKWSPESLITRSEEARAAAADMMHAVRQGERVVIQVQESKTQRVLGGKSQTEISMAQFRQGCVKSVEVSIGTLPQRGRVLAEIHRRLDRASQLDHDSAGWRSRWVSIYDFAGSWALAACLIRVGLSVSVVEGKCAPKHRESHETRADVEIIIPIGPATECA